MNSEQEFDRLLKEKLNERAFEFNEAHWSRLKPALVSGTSFLGGAAFNRTLGAALIVGVGLFAWWALGTDRPEQLADTTSTGEHVEEHVPGKIASAKDLMVQDGSVYPQNPSHAMTSAGALAEGGTQRDENAQGIKPQGSETIDPSGVSEVRKPQSLNNPLTSAGEHEEDPAHRDRSMEPGQAIKPQSHRTSSPAGVNGHPAHRDGRSTGNDGVNDLPEPARSLASAGSLEEDPAYREGRSLEHDKAEYPPSTETTNPGEIEDLSQAKEINSYDQIATAILAEDPSYRDVGSAKQGHSGRKPESPETGKPTEMMGVTGLASVTQQITDLKPSNEDQRELLASTTASSIEFLSLLKVRPPVHAQNNNYRVRPVQIVPTWDAEHSLLYGAQITMFGGLQASRSLFTDPRQEGIAVDHLIGHQLGMELVHMNRYLGFGAGVHHAQYRMRTFREAVFGTSTDINTTYFLTPDTVTITVVIDTVIVGGQPYYVTTSVDTTLMILDSNTDTVTSTFLETAGIDEQVLLDYVEVPFLLDIHLRMGRWTVGLRGGPTLGILSKGRISTATNDGIAPFTSARFKQYTMGYTARLYFDHTIADRWSVGMGPHVRGHFSNALSEGNGTLKPRAVGIGLSCSYRL